VGGTVDVLIAQRFRAYAKQFYEGNLSEALETALALFNKTLNDGTIPRMIQRQTLSYDT
jgi:hypothetical protein